MNTEYTYLVDDEAIEIRDSEDNIVGSVTTVEDAESLLGYLNAGQGGFSIEASMDEWALVYDGIAVAYTTSFATAEGLLTHLNRHSS